MIARRAVITGASSGIGRACALRLDAKGWIVYAGVLNDTEADELRTVASARLHPLVLDVTDKSSIAAAARLVSGEAGGQGLQGLVNNAGISMVSPLELISIDDLRLQLDVNVVGPVAVTQALLPMIRLGQGRIVNIGSASGSVATPFVGPYAASKAALERITDTLRMELAPWKIAVSLITPARVATPIWRTAGIAAIKVSRGMSSDARRLYDWPGAIAGISGGESPKWEADVAAVVKAVVHALTSARPRRLYPVNRWGRIIRTVAHLPGGSLRDWAALRATESRRVPRKG
jgi:NAD(P)-dependent dehydrogenase (short-subunit alcohol dehydrogenase family)